jgi:methylthioribose-1-phosphate isomerase
LDLEKTASKESLLFDTIRPVQWCENGVRLLDQRRLPEKEVYLDIHSTQALSEAIRDMCVRGAPAIGITAAFGAVIAAREAYCEAPNDFQHAFSEKLTHIKRARPTAVNLFNAIDAARALASTYEPSAAEGALLAWAKAWLADDIAANKQIGSYGAGIIAQPSNILTHCNAGALATGGYGTALGVVRSCVQQNLLGHLYSAETRPWSQGARLTAWELNKEAIPVTLIADSAAAQLMQKGLVDWVVVGADSITRNGDVINKIGTYSLAVLAKQHAVKVMVAAPLTSFDLNRERGQDVEIEERSSDELLPAYYSEHKTLVDAWNPVFDVTPATLIDVIVTEKGVLKSPNTRKMSDFMQHINY